jgi:hypothetical protein
MSKYAIQEILELQRRIESQRMGARVYNGSGHWQMRQFDSERYHMPPDGVAPDRHTGAMKTFDGVLEIRDLYRCDPRLLEQWRKDVDQGRGDPKHGPPNTVLRAPASQIAAHIGGKYQEQGLIALSGANDAENEVLKAQARKNFIASETVRCQDILRKYRSRTVGMQASDPERFYRQEETDAEKFLAKVLSGAAEAPWFLCNFQPCGFRSHVEADLADHYAFKHAAEMATDQATTESAPAKRGRGRPRKIEAST